MSSMVEPRVVVTLRISPKAHAAVKQRAEKADKTIAEMLREMLSYAERNMPR